MAHVWIIRECPSFVEGKNLMQGTHEHLEANIAKRKYKFKQSRDGYCIPASSEVKLMCYRIKEECIPEFLRDMRVVNLNPKSARQHNGKLTGWKKILMQINPFSKWHKDSRHSLMFGGFLGWVQLGLKLTRIVGIKLHPCDAAEGESQKFTDAWNYNFFIGYFKDPRNDFGQEEL